jgi:HEAT repeat protein
LLSDERLLVRASAAEALGEVGDAMAVEPLQARLKDEDTYVKDEAYRALEKMRKRDIRVD